MPGSHLSNDEKEIKKRWEHNPPKNALLGISIEGEPGLRGITSLSLDFRYPVTVICGKNGTGKTTILALAALAYHSIPGFHPQSGKMKPDNPNGRSYYTFSDFFFKGPNDSDCRGVKISWNYYNTHPISIKKRSEKWMHYERRPPKAVQYIGSNRILSAFEQSVLRSHFNNKSNVEHITPLNNEYLQYLSFILSNNYEFAGDLVNNSYHLRSCRTGSSYSSFNMGAGEDAIIEMLSYIQAMPKESLCIIEEIELGIHPEALTRLAKVIQEISSKKKMQFIISSHSRFFIDALPRCGRILLQRFENETSAFHSPTTRYAIGEMSNCFEQNKELCILCEDQVASCILQHALPTTIRKRVSIVPIGDKSQLTLAYNNLKTAYPQAKYVIVWDGDVSDTEASHFLAKIPNQDVLYFFLHSKYCPEKNILESIKKKGVALFQETFLLGTEAEAKSILSSLGRIRNHHDIFYELAHSTSIEVRDATSLLIRCYISSNSKYADRIAELVTYCLDHDATLQDHNRN